MATKKQTATAKKPKTVLMAVLANGEKRRVTGQDGKYIYCEGGMSLRHQSPNLKEVILETIEAGDE